MASKLIKKLFKNKKMPITIEHQEVEPGKAYVSEPDKPKKGKSPSRIRRNWIRAQRYWEAKRNARDTQAPEMQLQIHTPEYDQPTPPTPLGPPQDEQRASQNIALMYENLEVNMRLSRLEEALILTTALRHLVRTTHSNGKKITFPVPEAVDRIQLKCANIPTDPVELRSLIDQVYKRRNEPFDIEELYAQFVMTHGRIAFDSTQQWPLCHIHIRQP